MPSDQVRPLAVSAAPRAVNPRSLGHSAPDVRTSPLAAKTRSFREGRARPVAPRRARPSHTHRGIRRLRSAYRAQPTRRSDAASLGAKALLRVISAHARRAQEQLADTGPEPAQEEVTVSATSTRPLTSAQHTRLDWLATERDAIVTGWHTSGPIIRFEDGSRLWLTPTGRLLRLPATAWS